MSDTGNLAAEAVKYFMIRAVIILIVGSFLLGAGVVGLLWLIL